MKTKHTSGEWHFRTGMSDNFCEIIGGYETNKCIAVAPKDCFVKKNEAEANGRLIAAAPELLYACNTIFKNLTLNRDLNEYNISIMEIDAIINTLTRAISKATE
jgi:hypothetical protein